MKTNTRILLACCLFWLGTSPGGWCFYNPTTGRWLSRDPIDESGGLNSYGFAGNDSVGAIDPVGLVIACHCPEAYFKENGITPGMYTKSGDTYSAIAGGRGPTSGTGFILWRMLLTSHQFKAAGLKVENLKKHVAARHTIVNNALKANFRFGTGQKLDWTGFTDDPQAFFDKRNNGRTVIACQALSLIIFETGNRFGQTGWAAGHRTYEPDRVWIPGDWGYIINLAYTDDGDWTDENGQNRGVQGENVFCTGDDLFWGHFADGKHPAKSKQWWWNEVQSWTSKSGKHGTPDWRNDIKYPVTGLQP